jgi:hypothetical protein
MPQIILIEFEPTMVKSMHHLMRKRTLDPPRGMIIILTYDNPHFLIESAVHGHGTGCTVDGWGTAYFLEFGVEKDYYGGLFE